MCVEFSPAPRRATGTTFPRRPRVLSMRTGAQGSCDAEFHSGCLLLRVRAAAGAEPRPSSSCCPSAAVSSACPLAVLSLGERGRQATGSSPELGSRGLGGDRAELGPEGGGCGSEGGLGRAEGSPGVRSGGIVRTGLQAGGPGGGSWGNWEALGARGRTGCWVRG